MQCLVLLEERHHLSPDWLNTTQGLICINLKAECFCLILLNKLDRHCIPKEEGLTKDPTTTIGQFKCNFLDNIMLKRILCLPWTPGMMSSCCSSSQYSTFPLESLLLLGFFFPFSSCYWKASCFSSGVLCLKASMPTHNVSRWCSTEQLGPFIGTVGWCATQDKEKESLIRSCQIALPLLESIQPSSGLFYHFRIMRYPEDNVIWHILLLKTVNTAIVNDRNIIISIQDSDLSTTQKFHKIIFCSTNKQYKMCIWAVNWHSNANTKSINLTIIIN